MSQRILGIVKFYNEDKGFGFIIPDDGGSDVFVHRSGLPVGTDCLETDQHVSFVISESDRKKGDGKKATDVRLEND
jgi:CspA family cold shock protein